MAELIELRSDGGEASVLLPLDGGRLGVARTSGPVRGTADGAAAWVLVEGGAGTLEAGGDRVDVDGRRDVFTEPGWSAFVATGSSFSITGDVRATVVWRECDRDLVSRVIPPGEVVDEQRGSGASARRVRTYLPAGPLIAGETLNPPGGWSSYPPHRHEHEEVYVYRFLPAEGFGVAVNYDAHESTARVMRDGDVQRISSGYHPVTAAPGYTMYYLWALAGRSDTLIPEFDPVHAERA